MNLQTFNFNATNAVRTIMLKGIAHFVAADVCAILGYDHVPHAIRMLDKDEKGIQIVDTPGGSQKMTVINESGVWGLVLKSRKPEAKRMKKWLTSEVMPALYRTGTYTAPSRPTPQDARLTNALLALLMYVPYWDDVMRFREAGLTHFQICLLTGLPPRTLTRIVQRMTGAGLPVPESARKFGGDQRRLVLPAMGVTSVVTPAELN